MYKINVTLLSDCIVLKKPQNNSIINKKVTLDAIICDAPAKSFVLKIKGHTGFHSCTRCITEGEYISNCVAFPSTNVLKRTHLSFKTKQFEDHHTPGPLSILTEIPNIDIIKVFSLDYMHLICLGVVKKLLHLWLSKGPLPVRIRGKKIKELHYLLISLKHQVTSKFSRKPRGIINEVNRWKATEFRQFILYTGPVVLKNILSTECYIYIFQLKYYSILL